MPPEPTNPGSVKSPRAIGWREYVEFPDWDIPSILAKSDTGALGCAIDVDNIELLSGNRVQFDLFLSRKRASGQRKVIAEVVRQARVRSSNGVRQTRVTVATTVRIGGVSKRVEFSLVCRQNMLCRVLLGRKALETDFLVDSGRKFLLSSPPAVNGARKSGEGKTKEIPAAKKKKRRAPSSSEKVRNSK